jgi:hypothetical protein
MNESQLQNCWPHRARCCRCASANVAVGREEGTADCAPRTRNDFSFRLYSTRGMMPCYSHVTSDVHSQLSALVSQRQRFTGTPGAVPAKTHSFHHSGKLHSPCNATCTSVMPRQEHTLNRPHVRQHNAAELPEDAAARTQLNESSNHSLQATQAYAEARQAPLQQCGSQL